MRHATDDDLWEAPWWSWGFITALPLAFLALVTPWFEAVSPSDASDTITSTAWSHVFGILGPLWLMVAAWRWWGARRAYWPPSSPEDWWRLTSWSSLRGYSRTAEPMRTGAFISIAEGVVALLLLVINRALFHPIYITISVYSGYDKQQDVPVHAAFGCWCLLLAIGLFITTGVLGACLSEPEHAQ